MTLRKTIVAGALWLGASAWASADVQQSCQQLTPATLKQMTIISAEWLAESTQVLSGREQTLPAHCRVVGKINERVSEVDGETYAMGFEMRLPENWNQRFLMQANGGNDGVLVPAYGNFGNNSQSALSQGFAVMSSDAGHRSQRGSLIGGSAFGFDPQARLDYGYNAHVHLTEFGKALAKEAYGQPLSHAYFMGCSNGGRQTMVAASRLADQYDGFVAGNPGFNLPKAAIQHAWDVQTLSELNPSLSEALSRDDMALVAQGVLDACDDLDGLSDGMVNNLAQCQTEFDITRLQCADGASENCLAVDKVHALQKLFAGPVNSQGEALYSDWWWDAGISGEDWRRWKIQSPIAGLPLIATIGAGSLANIFMTPPDTVSATPPALLQYLREFDFDKDAPKIHATTDTFTESAMDFMTPPDVNHYKNLFANNRKMIVYHGASDGVFSVKDTVDWYQTLNQNHQGKAADNVRLFVVPGMNHCTGGPTTDQFDMLRAIVDWVEQGEAPDSVLASVKPDNDEIPKSWSKKHLRLLCPYPQVAIYQEGNTAAASSFECEEMVDGR